MEGGNRQTLHFQFYVYNLLLFSIKCEQLHANKWVEKRSGNCSVIDEKVFFCPDTKRIGNGKVEENNYGVFAGSVDVTKSLYIYIFSQLSCFFSYFFFVFCFVWTF